MKKSSYIQRLAVGLALLFATSNYTYAQFGGLLNAAKKKAQEQADPQRNLPSAGQTTAHRGWSQV